MSLISDFLADVLPAVAPGRQYRSIWGNSSGPDVQNSTAGNFGGRARHEGTVTAMSVGRTVAPRYSRCISLPIR